MDLYGQLESCFPLRTSLRNVTGRMPPPPVYYTGINLNKNYMPLKSVITVFLSTDWGKPRS